MSAWLPLCIHTSGSIAGAWRRLVNIQQLKLVKIMVPNIRNLKNDLIAELLLDIQIPFLRVVLWGLVPNGSTQLNGGWGAPVGRRLPRPPRRGGKRPGEREGEGEEEGSARSCNQPSALWEGDARPSSKLLSGIVRKKFRYVVEHDSQDHGGGVANVETCRIGEEDVLDAGD